MKVMVGHLIIGPDNGRNLVWTVKSMSILAQGDRKVWMVAWCGDAQIDAHVRFTDGDITAPWRHIDINDTYAMLQRVEVVLPASPRNLCVAVIRAAFASSPKESE